MTRDALVDAAVDLFGEHGFDRVAVSDIARRAGVSERTFFHYFPTKADVLFNLSPEDFEVMREMVAQQPRSSDYLKAIQAALVAFNTRKVDPKGHRRAVLLRRAAASSPTLRGKELDYNTAMAQAIAHGLADREGQPGPSRAMTIAATSSMMVMHLVVGEWTKTELPWDLTELVTSYFETLRHLL